MEGLNEKQQRFADEYLVDCNGTQAAIRSGYSENSAKEQASRLLTNANIRAYIEQKQSERSERTNITADFVLQGLREVALRCMQRNLKMDWDYESKSMQPVVDEDGNQVYEFDSTGANRSLELLGKHLALFTDKTQVSATDGFTITIAGKKDTP